METLILTNQRIAKICLILSGFLLPVVASLSPVAHIIVPVDHEARLKYARQIMSNEEYLNLAFTNADKGIETFIVDRMKEAWPNYSDSTIYGIANTLVNESNRAGIDPMFVMAVIQQESKFNPNIIGGYGEIGLMQIKPKTALWITALNKIEFHDKQDLFSPAVNIKIGILYLKYLNKKYGNAKYSTAAYNMGPRNLRRVLASEQEPQIYHSAVVKNYKALYLKIKNGQARTSLVAAH